VRFVQRVCTTASALALRVGEQHELGELALVAARVIVIDIGIVVVLARSANERGGPDAAAATAASEPGERQQTARPVIVILVGVDIIVTFIVIAPTQQSGGADGAAAAAAASEPGKRQQPPRSVIIVLVDIVVAFVVISPAH
jgi:hypothetical protein